MIKSGRIVVFIGGLGALVVGAILLFLFYNSTLMVPSIWSHPSILTMYAPLIVVSLGMMALGVVFMVRAVKNQ